MEIINNRPKTTVRFKELAKNDTFLYDIMNEGDEHLFLVMDDDVVADLYYGVAYHSHDFDEDAIVERVKARIVIE